MRRLKEQNFASHLVDLKKPPFDIKLTEIRKDMVVYGFCSTLLKIFPIIYTLLESILFITIVRFLKILSTTEDIPSYNEAYSECEKRLLEVK